VRVVVNWSGGKDCCLSCYEAISQGYEVSTLLNFVFTDYGRSTPIRISSLLKYLFTDVGRNTPHKVSTMLTLVFRAVGKRTPHKVSTLLTLVFRAVGKRTPHKVSTLFGAVNLNATRRMVPHEVAPEIVAMQAKAMELPIIQREVTWGTFEDQFKTAISKLERANAEGVVWGIIPPDTMLDDSRKLKKYINLRVQVDWIDKLCGDLGSKAIFPLWEKTPEQILAELVDKGFEVVVVVVNPDFVSEKWLGHKIDHDFIDELHRLNREKGVHLCGDEYHTLVTDGPLFKKRLKVLQSRKVSKDGYSILDMSKVELVDKD
jgi:diphthine-ammonia ligase